MKLITILLLLLSFSAYAQLQQVQEPLVFESQQQQDRFDQLTKELRCLVCQNQNLAGSDADLARDLRRETYDMLSQGKSQQQVVEFMVARYGDFVLYRPPVQTNTYLLWVAPMILLLGGALVLRSNIKKRAALLGDAPRDDENSPG